jgi:hypothetical protein
VLVIDLSQEVGTCAICGDETDGRGGVPMYEDLVLPDDWQGEWGGFDACEACRDVQRLLTAPAPAAVVRRVRELAP